MKRILFLLGMLCASTIYSQENGDQLFTPDILHEIRIVSDNPNFFDDIVEDFNLNFFDTVPYRPAMVIIDGISLDSVGVRVKGGVSAFDAKKPLKLDFNRFIDGQQFDGLRKVNLHNAYFDPSMQREVISYHVLRQAGLKTPRTAFTEVYINDELQGVYSIIEQIDRTFLSNYFASDAGVLYKTIDSGILEIKSEDGTFEQYDRLINTVIDFDGAALVDTLEKILDTEAFLRNIATQNIINATDNLIDVNYNYYIYFEPKSGLMYYIPWDFNLAFFPFANYPIDQVPNNIVAQKMLSIPVYQQRYYELFCEALDYNFVESDLHALLDTRKQIIEAAIAVDPLITFTVQEFEAEQIVVKEWITSRIAQLQQELNTLQVECSLESIPFQAISINEIMASSDSTGGITDPAGGYPDWIELYNNTNEAISLDKYYLSDDRDFRKHWAFPSNTTIEANGYLIIWADRDLNEEGLHADFKLNKQSGELFLIYEDFTVVDEMEYGQQEKNVAYARVPNGTGDFVQQAATFNDFNAPISVVEQANRLEWSAIPNPASDYLTVQISEEHHQKLNAVTLIDVYGRILTKQKTLSLPITQYPPGIYWIGLELDDQPTTFQKILIQR